MIEIIAAVIGGLLSGFLPTYFFLYKPVRSRNKGLIYKDIIHISKDEQVDDWFIYMFCNHPKKDCEYSKSIVKIPLFYWDNQKYYIESIDSQLYSSKTINIFKESEKYNGYFTSGRSFITIFLCSDNEDETLHRFEVMNKAEEQFFGVFASTNYANNPCCGISILSKNELTREKIDEFIKINYKRDFNFIYIK